MTLQLELECTCMHCGVIINESSGAFILNQGGGGRCGEGLFEGGGGSIHTYPDSLDFLNVKENK